MGIYDNPGVPILSIITYIPLVGAVVSGFLAVIVALSSPGSGEITWARTP